MLSDQRNSIHPYTEKHVIETPEQMRLEFGLAGIGSRFLALAIDTLIQVGLALVIVIVAAIVGLSRALGWSQGHLWGLAVLIGLSFLLYFGYFALFEILWGGQTPGKRAIGIRVIKETGRPLSASETLARNLMRIVDQLPGFYGVGVLVALFNFRNQRIGDFVAGSIVVREQPLEEMRPVWESSQPAPAESRLGAEKLTAEDFALIEAFLNRRSELADGLRSRMAGEILRRLEGKLALNAAAQRSSAETILESLIYERRSIAGY